MSCITDPELCSSARSSSFSRLLQGSGSPIRNVYRSVFLRCKASPNNLNAQVGASADGRANTAAELRLLPATVEHDFDFQTSGADVQSHTYTPHTHTHVRGRCQLAFYFLILCKIHFKFCFVLFFSLLMTIVADGVLKASEWEIKWK